MKLKLPEELSFLTNGRKKQKISTTRMDGKVCVISGGTSGVGLSAAKELAKGGAHLILVARNEEKAKRIKNEIQTEFNVPIYIYIADFSDFDSVRNAANKILNDVKHIDVLINSAGIHSTRRTYNKDGIEKVFSVNHLGIFLFTYLLKERMIDSSPSRIIQVNSEGHRFSTIRVKNYNFKRKIYTGLRSYGQSKTAQLYTIWKMAEDLKEHNVTLNAVHPGAVKSNIGHNNGFLYRWFLKYVTGLFLKNPKISGEAIYYLASDPEMEDVTGKFFNLTIEEKPAWHALKKERIQPVWDLTMKLTGLDKSK